MKALGSIFFRHSHQVISTKPPDIDGLHAVNMHACPAFNFNNRRGDARGAHQSPVVMLPPGSLKVERGILGAPIRTWTEISRPVIPHVP